MHFTQALALFVLVSSFTINASAQTLDRSASDGTNEVYKLTSRALAVGMDRSEVLERLGQPAAKLTPNIWAYPITSARTHVDGETLVVFLRKDRVQTLFVGNDEALVALTADLREQLLSAQGIPAK